MLKRFVVGSMRKWWKVFVVRRLGLRFFGGNFFCETSNLT